MDAMMTPEILGRNLKDDLKSAIWKILMRKRALRFAVGFP